MSNISELARVALLREAQDVELLPGVKVKIARTPVGDGLASFMSVKNRRRELIWSKVPSEDLLEGATLSESGLKIINEYFKNNIDVDYKDIVEAFYFSAFRLDQNITKDDIKMCIDEENIEKAFRALVDVNDFDRSKLPNDQPANQAGQVNTSSTQTTGEIV